MAREIYMLEHRGRLLTELGVFKTRERAEEMVTDNGVIQCLQPAIMLKYFVPEKYDRLCADWRPPAVVAFREVTEK
jgi:hypothetical protein